MKGTVEHTDILRFTIKLNAYYLNMVKQLGIKPHELQKSYIYKFKVVYYCVMLFLML